MAPSISKFFRPGQVVLSGADVLIVIRSCGHSGQYLCHLAKWEGVNLSMVGGPLNIVQRTAQSLHNAHYKRLISPIDINRAVYGAISYALRQSINSPNAALAGVGFVWVVPDAQYSDGSVSSDSKNRQCQRRLVQVTPIVRCRALFVTVTTQSKEDTAWYAELPAGPHYANAVEEFGCPGPLKGIINCSSLESRPPPPFDAASYHIKDALMREVCQKILDLYYQ